MTMNGSWPERVNLGCGPNAPAGWLNVDGSWNAWLTEHRHLRGALGKMGFSVNRGSQWKVQPLVHDLKKPLPLPTNTFYAIYASHVLEHLYRVEAQRLLQECRRVLRPGGLIRLVVPDLHSMVIEYLNNKDAGNSPISHDPSAGDRLNERLGFRSAAPPNGNFVYRFYATWKDFHSHKWMYDSASLARCLELAGFQGVASKGFRESNIPGIEEVEEEGRVLGGAGVCVEGIKL